MRQRVETKVLKPLLKHLRIGLGAFALVLLPVSVPGSGDGRTVLAEVAHAAEIASSQVVDTLDNIGAEFALSEPVYRGTDRGDAILILALVFSGIIAFNLWLFGHLRCVYAPATTPSSAR
jgi:hypothetical protein